MQIFFYINLYVACTEYTVILCVILNMHANKYTSHSLAKYALHSF